MRGLIITGLLLLYFQIVPTTCLSQMGDSANFEQIKKGDRYLSFLLGYNIWKNHFAEVGIALNQLNTVGHHPLGVTYFISNEVRIFGEPLMGPKIGCWFAGGASAVAMGINAVYYTDLKSGALRFRPEIGLGLDRIKIVYGYNIPITHRDFGKINRSNISIVALLTLVKLRERKQ